MKQGRCGDRSRHPRCLIGEPAAAKSADTLRLAEQCRCRRPPQGDEQVWVDQLDDTLDERHTGGDFGRSRASIAGRAPEDRVCYEDVGSIQADRGEHLVEQSAARTNERHAAPILFGTRCLTDQHDVSSRIAITKNQVRRRSRQRATVESVERRAHILERSRPLCQRHRTLYRRGCRRDGSGGLGEGPTSGWGRRRWPTWRLWWHRNRQRPPARYDKIRRRFALLELIDRNFANRFVNAGFKVPAQQRFGVGNRAIGHWRQRRSGCFEGIEFAAPFRNPMV